MISCDPSIDRFGEESGFSKLPTGRPGPIPAAFTPYLRSVHHIIDKAAARNTALGKSAENRGDQFCSNPRCENRLFSIWKKMPSMMPENTFTPTLPERVWI